MLLCYCKTTNIVLANHYYICRVSYVELAIVTVYNTVVRIAQKQVVTVNNMSVILPHYIPDKNHYKIKVEANGLEGTILSTDFGLQVIYWSSYRLCTQVPKVPGYMGNLCGFGGNMNGDYKDDLKLPNGTIELRNQSDLFGDSWVVDTSDCLLAKVRRF